MILYFIGFAVASSSFGIRWMRVAQREHYVPGSVTRFAVRWFRSSPANMVLFLLAASFSLAIALVDRWLSAGAIVFFICAVAPIGLSWRGRSGELRWTRRMVMVLALALVVLITSVIIAVMVRPALLPSLLLLLPLMIDACLLVARPIEYRASTKYVQRAQAQLHRIRPQVVGITGSYGKTTVKNYAAHLLSQTSKAVASRRSFNNRLGLASSINQDLDLGTDFYVAEVGTYGPGEISDVCQWLAPRVSVITAIGPVHLERMKSLDRIEQAKREILESAEVAVLNVDDERLNRVASECEKSGIRVVRCSRSRWAADVRAATADGILTLFIAGREFKFPIGDRRFIDINLALSLGVAMAVDRIPLNVESAVLSLPDVPHRGVEVRTPGMPTIIDDTYNSNPAGAATAIERLVQAGGALGGRKIVVTPGMVELGRIQEAENRAFGRLVADVGAELVVVGWTNRAALTEGYRDAAGREPCWFRLRTEAVASIRSNTLPDDVVLFENDLPDHYP